MATTTDFRPATTRASTGLVNRIPGCLRGYLRSSARCSVVVSSARRNGLRPVWEQARAVAISNRRLVAADANAIAFRRKDYRIDRPDRWKTMTLSPHEFIGRFLMHVLPKGLHRIRHYGLFANGNRAANVARSRELLGAMPRVVEPAKEQTATTDEPRLQPCTCPRCGARMIIIEVFARGCEPRYRPTPAPTSMRIDTS